MRDENIKEKIRVLHLIEHLKFAGAEKVVFDLVQTLDRSRFHSTVCLYRGMGPLADDLQTAGYPIVFIRKDFLTRFLPGSPRILLAPLLLIESLIFIIRLAGLIRRNKFHIIHSHMFSANLWGRLSSLLGGHPGIITTEHTKRSPDKSIKRKIINRMLSPFSDRVVAVSQEIAKTVVREQKLSNNKMVVIPNGVRLNATEKPDKASLDKKPKDLDGDHPLIAIIGRLTAVKRHDLLLRALQICVKRIPSINCWIIGDGPERAGIEHLAQRLDLSDRVFLLGERNDVRELLHYVDLVVNTSDREGLPLSLLEAMAEGVSVVATDVGGTREIIQTGETGILVEAGNVHAIANGICRLIENPESSKKMGLIGRSRVKKFYSLDKVALMWEKLYHEVFIERKPG